MAELRRPTWLLVLALSLSFATRARAQGEEEEKPTTVNAVRGAIKGSTRFIGLGGAFVAIADDTEGVPINPASTAVRLPYSWDAFSFSFGVDFSIATWLPKNNIYNAPESAAGDGGSLFGSLAALINYRHAGFGVSAEAEQNAVSQQSQGISSKLTASFGLIHTAAAYGYFDGQLQLGAGLRILGFSLGDSDSSGPLAAGIGYTAGFIVKPKRRQFRIGVAIEQPINARVPGEEGEAPVTVHVPWTAALGFAYQFGGRPLNAPFVAVGDRARRKTGGREPTKEEVKKAEQELFAEYQQQQTWYLLLSTELALTQGGGDATLGNYLITRQPLVSPRLGIESEVVPRYLRLRAGSYLELAATEQGHARLHGTGGLDVKLFRWNVFGLVGPFDYWQLSLAADGAKSYLNTSFSIGFWH